MKQRNLANHGLMVSMLGLGCMGVSEFYGSRNDQESIATNHPALKPGINFLDTADVHCPFANEAPVSKAIRGRREQVVPATKFGNIRDPNDPAARRINGKPEYVRKACEGSLRRLGVETIDVCYQHRGDPHTLIHQGGNYVESHREEGWATSGQAYLLRKTDIGRK